MLYLDKILILSTDLKSYQTNLAEVLGEIHYKNLYYNTLKCEFFKEVKLLGYSIKHGGFAIAPYKVEVVTNWPTPTARLKINGFLGLFNLFLKFNQNFSAIMRLLTHLTLDNIPLKWNYECKAALDKLKVAFNSAPVLILPDLAKQFFLETDASE